MYRLISDPGHVSLVEAAIETESTSLEPVDATVPASSDEHAGEEFIGHHERQRPTPEAQ